MNSVCRRRSVGSNCAQKCSVNSVCSVREKNILCERRNFPRHFSNVLFLTENTEEQNTQGPTETLSQPITQNVTATFSSNALWTLYAEGLLWARNVRQKPPWTLCALWEKTYPHTPTMFFFSQNNTDEQNTQHSTETLSQPISQNVTANLSWKASVISVCRRRSVSSKRWLKGSVKSVSSVREKTLQREKTSSSSPSMHPNSWHKKPLHITELTILKVRGWSLLW